MALMFLGRRERARVAAEAERAGAPVPGRNGARRAAAADDEELVSLAQAQASLILTPCACF
jgi:hypothetical protein